jgi:lipoprotein-anchoring transpeptidase ErfK/SrfK
MKKIKALLAAISLVTATNTMFGTTGVSVQIDLSRQTAYLIQGRDVVLRSPISSGRIGHITPTGSFKVIEKERNHFSSIYGKIVDRNGRTMVSDADVDMRVPQGGRFLPAPMRYFIRFHGADGMHAGYLPGYPASHGCVRMPEQLAIAFFNAVEVGTPVEVYGRLQRSNRPVDPFGRERQPRARSRVLPPMNPYLDRRFIPPPYVNPYWQ